MSVTHEITTGERVYLVDRDAPRRGGVGSYTLGSGQGPWPPHLTVCRDEVVWDGPLGFSLLSYGVVILIVAITSSALKMSCHSRASQNQV